MPDTRVFRGRRVGRRRSKAGEPSIRRQGYTLCPDRIWPQLMGIERWRRSSSRVAPRSICRIKSLLVLGIGGPLYEAARYGHADIVALLIDHGRDVDAKDRGGDTVLHHAGDADSGTGKAVEVLVNAGATL